MGGAHTHLPCSPCFDHAPSLGLCPMTSRHKLLTSRAPCIKFALHLYLTLPWTLAARNPPSPLTSPLPFVPGWPLCKNLGHVFALPGRPPDGAKLCGGQRAATGRAGAAGLQPGSVPIHRHLGPVAPHRLLAHSAVSAHVGPVNIWHEVVDWQVGGLVKLPRKSSCLKKSGPEWPQRQPHAGPCASALAALALGLLTHSLTARLDRHLAIGNGLSDIILPLDIPSLHTPPSSYNLATLTVEGTNQTFSDFSLASINITGCAPPARPLPIVRMTGVTSENITAEYRWSVTRALAPQVWGCWVLGGRWSGGCEHAEWWAPGWMAVHL